VPPLSCTAARSFRLGRARGDFDPERSDIDFLVEFDRGHPDALSLQMYFGFKESLEALFGLPVDLVEPGAVRNPYRKANIEGSRGSLKRDPALVERIPRDGWLECPN
jgi:predicted nucleotidyltransferase